MKYVLEKAMNLLEALATSHPESSRNTLRKWIKDGRVMVDDKQMTETNAILQKGQTVVLSGQKMKHERGLKIIYEDEHLVVVNKPSGLLSVATNFETKRTAHAFLKEHYSSKKVYVIHRLDFETSGLMVFALSWKAYVALKEALAQRLVTRIYNGIVEGKLEGSGMWKSYLQEDAKYHVHTSKNPEFGEEAITHYDVLQPGSRYSFVRFQLQTGKKNQIRVQAKEHGHPLVGDSKYGAVHNPIKRVALHASKLSFCHPVSQKNLSFDAPLPSEFLSLLEK